ncbi:MAG: hypothetical protein WCA30_10960, partial [Dermatophilaceae bacterium]
MPDPGIRFRVPPPRRALVERTRLVGRLPTDADRMPRLLLVAASAGFGKTTLLTQWLTAFGAAPSPPAVAWLSVDHGDRDIRQLLTDLLAAIDHATGGDIPHTKSLLDTERQTPVEDILA